MHGLITDVVFNNETGQPADNKWMSVFPCHQDLGLGLNFHCVLSLVEAYLNGEHAAADGPLPDDFAIDQDWATARKAYARRAARLIHSGTAAPRLLFALGTLGPLMHGHASLFKRGTNQQPSGAKPSIGSEASDIFDFADLDRSPLVPIFAQLCDYFMGAFHSASSETFWRPVIRAASDDGRLPQDMLWLFRSVLCKVISGMYRRLLAICLKDPWVLTKMFDPRTPDDERRRLVDGLLQKRQCCLHKYLTLKLVRRHGISVETMLDAVLREFIASFFNSCPLTTTLLECEFAQLNAILGSSKRPLSMHATNAFCLVDRLDSDYKLIRDNCDDLDKSRRPLWAQAWGAGRNGREGLDELGGQRWCWGRNIRGRYGWESTCRPSPFRMRGVLPIVGIRIGLALYWLKVVLELELRVPFFIQALADADLIVKIVARSSSRPGCRIGAVSRLVGTSASHRCA